MLKIEFRASEGLALSPTARVSTFGLTAGPQLITALSEGRGYGEAGGEGSLYWREINEIPHPPLRGPPSPASGRGLLSSDISQRS